jgi:hypothetical protein
LEPEAVGNYSLHTGLKGGTGGDTRFEGIAYFEAVIFYVGLFVS